MSRFVLRRPKVQVVNVLLRSCFLITLASFVSLPQACCQALSTATVGIFPSVFAGATATDTGFDSATNVAITGGLDIGFYSGRRFEYAIEYRGIYPLKKGEVDSQKSNLIGLNLLRRTGRLHPYGDIFYGRAEIDYSGAGAQIAGTPIFYTKSSSNVIAGGGGATFDFGSQFALKLDVLLQRYNTPVTASGHLYPASASIDFLYRIRPRRRAGDQQLRVNPDK